MSDTTDRRMHASDTTREVVDLMAELKKSIELHKQGQRLRDRLPNVVAAGGLGEVDPGSAATQRCCDDP